LPDGALPAPWDEHDEDFAPYDSRDAFELADLLYRRTQMPQGQIDSLLQIWARTMVNTGKNPPFCNARDLYDTIDATEDGHIPWQSFLLSYQPKEDEVIGETSWKRKSFDVWFRDPHKVLLGQLLNRDFAKEMDFAAKEARDSKTKIRRFRDFMSGEWAWGQSVRIIILSKITLIERS
jgi:hypothetical protein